MAIRWNTLKTEADLLEEYKQSVLPKLNQIRDDLISSGVVYNGNIFQTRDRDVQDMMGVLQVAQLAAAQGTPFATKWLTAANVEVQLDLPTLSGLGVVVAEHKKHLVYKCREHKDNVLALNSKEEVDSYMNNLSWE